jgi:hypothetical protein
MQLLWMPMQEEVMSQGALKNVWNIMKEEYHRSDDDDGITSTDGNNKNKNNDNSTTTSTTTAANPYNIRIYGALITSYSKSRELNAPYYEADKLMAEMDDFYEKGIMIETPNQIVLPTQYIH